MPATPLTLFWALALLFRPFGVKFVFDHHDLSPEMYLAKGKRKDLLYRGLLWLERRTLRFADLIIAVNRTHKEIAVRRGKLPPRRSASCAAGRPLPGRKFILPIRL